MTFAPQPQSQSHRIETSDNHATGTVGDTSNSRDVDNSEPGDSGECPICYESLGDDIITTICAHTFHINCMEKWEKSFPVHQEPTCPMCRSSLTIANEPCPHCGRPMLAGERVARLQCCSRRIHMMCLYRWRVS